MASHNRKSAKRVQSGARKMKRKDDSALHKDTLKSVRNTAAVASKRSSRKARAKTGGIMQRVNRTAVGAADSVTKAVASVTGAVVGMVQTVVPKSPKRKGSS